MSRKVIARAVHLIRATTRDAIDHDLAGEAAKMAYYFFLSLFPLLLIEQASPNDAKPAQHDSWPGTTRTTSTRSAVPAVRGR